MPYLEPLDADAAPEVADIFALYERTRGFTPNSVRTMARRPRIASAFAELNQAILYEGTVPEALKMLVSLVASTAAGCRYCQSHMATRATFYDVADEKIARVWEFETSELFDEAERAALRLARDAALVPNLAGPEHFAELARHFDEGQIVELVATIALFGYLNRWNDTMATELERFPLEVTRDRVGLAGWEPGKHAPGGLSGGAG